MAEQAPEALQIALESSGELLAPDALVQRIEKDLKLIRAQFPAVADVKHTQKWQPGKLMINDVNQASLDAINTSPYGPSKSKAIFQDKIFLVEFEKQYNPEKLAEILKAEYGIQNARPDGVFGGSSSITLTKDDKSGKYTYEIMKGWGDCMSGCINKHFWTFTTGPGDSVELVGERGDDPNTANEGGQRPGGGIGIF